MSMVKRFAVTEDLPALRAIWVAAFPDDTPAERDAFLSHVRLPEECLVAVADGTPVSMVFSLPVTAQAGRLQYIYAAATLPAYRGRGVFGDLLNTALDTAREQGCIGSFLRPAQPSLVAYYARFGYRPWVYAAQECGVAAPHGAAVTTLSPEEYAARRTALLPAGAVAWDTRFVTYAAACGRAVSTDNAVALCYTAENCLIIKEWLGEGDPAALCTSLGCARYKRRVPTHVPTAEPLALLLPFTKAAQTAAPYIGLFLD